ncbi:MAG: hypothetical protein EBS05_16890 [Proteobacteria bacterium]|nr:hypothetical protein [Pseudomonadota bacterium]
MVAILRSQGLSASFVGKTAGEGQYTPPSGFPRAVVHPGTGQTIQCSGVSHDAIWVGEAQFDLIANGNDGSEPLGSPGIPVANEIPAQYYRPQNPPVYPIEGAPVPPPAPAKPPYPGDTIFDQVGAVLWADYAEAGRTPDAQVGRWFGRTIYDWLVANEPTLEASITKHRAEWRALLGLR